MATSTPWITAKTTAGWGPRHATPGTDVVYYPVNDMPPMNPRSFSTAPGRRFASMYQRMQNRYTSEGTGGMTVNVDLTGQSALSTAWYGGALLEACGFDKSGSTIFSYTLASPNVGDGNVVRADMQTWDQDSRVVGIADCVGGAVISVTAGQIPNITFNMVGIPSINTTALVEAVSVTTPPFGVAACGATFTLESVALILRSLTISTNPVIAMRPSVAGTYGYAAPCITGYECSALARVELDTTSLNPETIFTGATPNQVLELSCKLPAGGCGVDAGADFVTITGDFQIDGQPQRVDDDGIICLDIPLILDPSTIDATADTTNGLKIAWTAS